MGFLRKKTWEMFSAIQQDIQQYNYAEFKLKLLYVATYTHRFKITSNAQQKHGT